MSEVRQYATGEALEEFNVLEKKQSIERWELMARVRDADDVDPIERYALGFYGSKEALNFFNRLQSRVIATTEQPVVAINDPDIILNELVYGISTGRFRLQYHEGIAGGFGANLHLVLGDTIVIKDEGWPTGHRYDEFDLSLDHIWFTAGTVSMYEEGSLKTYDPIDRPATILMGHKEIMAYEKINRFAGTLAAAQLALEDRVPVDSLKLRKD